LKPDAAAADPNELKPNVDNSAPPAAPPTQVNEIEPRANGQAAAAGSTTADTATANDKEVEDAMSSSKRKKKKGLRKVVPF
jgi:hypothetical protein